MESLLALDSTSMAVTASVAVATLYTVKRYLDKARAHRKLMTQRKRGQSVEVGESKQGGGRAHRKTGFTDKLVDSYDPKVTTSYEMFNEIAAKNGSKPYLGTRANLGEDKYGDYQWQTYSQVLKRRDNIASGLQSLYNLSPGDFVGLYSINRPEWVLTDLACPCFGLASIALYDTLGQNAVEFILKHAEIKIVVCAKKQLMNMLKAGANCPTLKTIVCMDPISDEEKSQAASVNITLNTLEEVEKHGAANPVKPTPSKPEDIYTVMYTSGTTGDPKGVILTHACLIAELSGVRKMEAMKEDDVHMSYLPLAHSFERAVLYSVTTYGSAVGFFSGNINNLFNDIGELKPTFLIGAPRVWARLYDKLTLTINGSGFIKKTLFQVGFNAKKQALERGEESPMWDSILFSKTKARLGGRVRFILSGSAPLDPKLGEFLRVCFCCPVLEGYGLTENFAAAALTALDETQLGHVGAPIPSIEIKLLDVPEMGYSSQNTPQTGEIMLRGPHVFKGYYKDAEKTKEAFDEDGWFHTGDIGRWNPNGTLSIIDRKKNIFKLSQGEYVAVEYLENVFTRSGFVSQIWVYGSSYKRFLVAVVVLDKDFILPWAAQNGIQGSYEDLAKNPAVEKAVLDDLEKVGKTAKLQGFELIKAVQLTSSAFTVDNDLITPTFKLRRVQLQKLYKKEIDEMYAKIGD